jgi:ribonuclease J
MEQSVRIASELGYLRVPEGTLLPLEELAALPPYRQVILSTGSQGEPNSAMALMAAEEHKYVEVAEGDLVILSARIIPGHERTITRLVNQLLRLGAEVLWEPVAFVHVSGHASQDELRLMLNLIRPTFFIPVHGEYRHLLAHGRLARDSGVAEDRVFVIEDGQAVEFTKTAGRLLKGIPVGRVLVDGKGIGDVGAVVLRDRQLLAQDGMVVVAVTVDRGTGEIIAGPEIASRGWVYERESEAVLEEAKTVLREALAARTGEEPMPRDVLQSLLRGTLRRFITQRYDRKPIVLPIILEA